MKLASLILLCLLSVGAWGQTGKTGIVDCAAHPDLCRASEGATYHQGPSDTDEFTVTGPLSGCKVVDKREICVWEIPTLAGDVWEPEDVPAIQEPAKSIPISVTTCGDDMVCSDDTMGCSNNGKLQINDGKGLLSPWTCTDGWKWSCRDKAHRTLMQTEDGKTHYCHRPEL